VLADQAQARLGEGAELANLGRLTPSRASDLANRFRVLSDEAQRRQVQAAEEGDVAGAARLACGLQAALDGQAGLLASVGARTGGSNADAAAGLEASAREEAADALALCGALEAKAGLNLRAEAQAALQAAQDALARARARLDQAQGALGADLAADADAQLDAAGRIVAGGQDRLDAGAAIEAAEFFRLADRLAEDVSTRTDAMLNIHAQGAANGDAIIRSVKGSGDANVGIDGLLNLDANRNAAGGSANVDGTVNSEAGAGTGVVAPIVVPSVGGSADGSAAGTGGVTVEAGDGSANGTADAGLDLGSGVIFPSL
jgi:hypothetical protein